MHHVRAVSVALAVSIATFVACVTVPETGRKQFIVPPEGYMNSLGESAFAEIKQKEPVSTNAGLTSAVTEVGRRIASASQKAYSWEFALFESPDVNAFCLPGGKVGVYTGLLPVAETNAGLAAVMGHEVAHAVARHGAERATHSLLVAGVLITIDQVMKDEKRKQLVMAAMGVGAQFGIMLPYSRHHESEADKIGLLYMAKAGYDPRAAVSLWERMAKMGKTPPELISTHPDPNRRAADLAAQLPKVLPIYEQSSKVVTTPLL